MTVHNDPHHQFLGLDHIGLTVPNVLEAVKFYEDVFGAKVLYRMGTLDARDMPPSNAGDWTAGFIGVPDAKLTFVGMQLLPNLAVEVYEFYRAAGARKKASTNCDYGYHHVALRVADLDVATAYLISKGFSAREGPIDPPDGPLLGSRSWYLNDPWGNQFELTEYEQMAFMAEAK